MGEGNRLEMKIYNSLDDVKLKKSIVTVGKFDGLHMGHREIIKKMKDIKTDDEQLVVITFATMPSDVFSDESSIMILTQNEKIRYFEMQNIDTLIVIEDVKELLLMSAEEFVSKILIDKLDTVHFVCGDDFRFGKDRIGDVAYLKEYGKSKFDVHNLEKIKYDKNEVSSSRIRECIVNGDIKTANDMLLSKFSFIGVVEHGAHIGTGMKMPTVNIIPDEDKIIPPFGVYASTVVIGKDEYKGITNIGTKPTVSNKEIVGVETHIFDVDMDLYDKIVEVKIYDFIRPERKFANLMELKAQVDKDMSKVRDMNL